MQASLFDLGSPQFDPALGGVRREELSEGAWIDYLPTWLGGHESVFSDLVRMADWNHHRRQMYERVVDVPRLTANAPSAGRTGALLEDMASTLTRHYRVPLGSVTLAWYRDGRDSVAPHGDRIGRDGADTVVAIVSVGAPRRFVLRPTAGGPARSFALGWGDLLVMGGTCQRTWQHAIPKLAHADPRISIQFRPEYASQPA